MTTAIEQRIATQKEYNNNEKAYRRYQRGYDKNGNWVRGIIVPGIIKLPSGQCYEVDKNGTWWKVEEEKS